MIDNNEKKLYLLVDRDDVTVKSAPLIQMIINEKTNFKTEVLSMFEQLIRNCRYFADEVSKVCDAEEDWVEINAAKYYLHVANLFLNQFLEERDTFLEIDNLPKGSRKYFDYAKEMDVIIKVSELIDKNKEAFHVINAFCMKRLERIIKEAKEKNAIPNFGSLFSMDTNDIIKKGTIKKDASREYILYEKPIEILKNCIKNENRIHDIVTNANVYYQPSQALVDYEKIHSLENVNWDAIDLIEELIHSGIFEKEYESSHKTGPREDMAKERSERVFLPEINGYLSKQFHEEEHNAARRGRSSKVQDAIEKLGIEPEQIVIIDDSYANCLDAIRLGANAIYYKPVTDSEKINGQLEETGLDRITSFKEHGKVYGYISKAAIRLRGKSK